MLKEEDILFEIGDFWVKKEMFGSGKFEPKSQGYSVYKCGITCSTQVAIIGFSGAVGLSMAKEKATSLFIEAVNGKTN